MMTEQQVAEVAATNRTLHEAADAILMKSAKGGVLTPNDITLLRSVGISTGFELKKHVGRVERVLRMQEIAGTREDRAKLARDIKKAEAKKAKELPGIRQELDETVKRLQKQIDDLEAAVTVRTRKLDRMEEHVVHLRKRNVVPTFIQDEYNALSNAVGHHYHDVTQAESTKRTMERRLETIRKLMTGIGNTLMPNSPMHQFIDSQKLCQDGNSTKACPHKVAAFKTKCEKELAACNETIEARKETFEKAKAECESALDYYIV